MAFNRELSQLGSFLVVDDNTRKIAITTTTTPFVGIGTTNPEYKLDVDGDVNFTGRLFSGGDLFTAGVGIGSTSIHPGSGDILTRIGVGFTDINFVGTGLSITGYGSTVVVELGAALSISTITTGVAQDLTFVSSASTSILGIATPTDPVVYEPSTGRVGIGTSTPSYKLDVMGDINSSTTVKVAGVDLLDEQVRLAFALG